jgi:hypothetical protein
VRCRWADAVRAAEVQTAVIAHIKARPAPSYEPQRPWLFDPHSRRAFLLGS